MCTLNCFLWLYYYRGNTKWYLTKYLFVCTSSSIHAYMMLQLVYLLHPYNNLVVQTYKWCLLLWLKYTLFGLIYFLTGLKTYWHIRRIHIPILFLGDIRFWDQIPCKININEIIAVLRAYMNNVNSELNHPVHINRLGMVLVSRLFWASGLFIYNTTLVQK